MSRRLPLNYFFHPPQNVSINPQLLSQRVVIKFVRRRVFIFQEFDEPMKEKRYNII